MKHVTTQSLRRPDDDVLAHLEICTICRSQVSTDVDLAAVHGRILEEIASLSVATPPPARAGSRWWNRPWIIAAAAAAAVVAVFVPVAWLGAQIGDDMANSSPPVTVASTPIPVAPVVLVPFEPDPAVLTLPAVVPEGMQVCEEEPLVLCDPGDGSRSITITHHNEMLRGTSSAGVDGIRRMPGEDLAMAIWFPQSALIYDAEGIPSHQLVSIVSSVPLASNDAIVVPDEPPLTEPLPRQFVAELVGVPEEAVDDHGGGTWGVNTGDIVFGYSPVDKSWQDVRATIEIRELAAALKDPTSLSQDRTLVAGYLPGFDKKPGEYTARWFQRGIDWWIWVDEFRGDGSTVTIDEFVVQVRAMERLIAEYP